MTPSSPPTNSSVYCSIPSAPSIPWTLLSSNDQQLHVTKPKTLKKILYLHLTQTLCSIQYIWLVTPRNTLLSWFLWAHSPVLTCSHTVNIIFDGSSPIWPLELRGIQAILRFPFLLAVNFLCNLKVSWDLNTTIALMTLIQVYSSSFLFVPDSVSCL